MTTPHNRHQAGAISSSFDNCIDLLKATTDLASVLLSNQDLDSGVNQALKILETSVKAERLTVLKHHKSKTEETLGYVTTEYEWLADGIKFQIDHPKLHRITYEGIEDCYNLHCVGKHWGGLIDTLPEPFRSRQLKLGVKATYAIPILVKGKYWGAIGLDFCQTARSLEDEEIEILKTAAACIGGAIAKECDRCAQEKAKKAIFLEREKAAQAQANQLAKHNQVLQQRDNEVQRSCRLLAATASAANIISTEKSLDLAINQALQIIGETINTDRVSVMEHFDDSSGQSVGLVKMIYEWHSVHTVAQINHPQVREVSWNGIEDWYQLMRQGKWAGGVVNELPEPFRTTQRVIGIKSTYAIPISVEGKYWGIAGFDDCRKETHRSEAELSILKTAAACIGGAIEKERSRCAQDKAEKAILLEREKAAIEKSSQLAQSNQTLSLRDCWLEATANAANKLLEIADLDAGINAALKVLGESLNCDRVNIMEHFESFPNQSHEFVRVVYEWDSLGTISQISHPELDEISVEGIEDWFIKLKAGDWIGGTIDEFREPFRSSQAGLGIKATYSVPIFVNSIYWGAICIDFCREPRCLTTPEIAVFKTAASCIGSAIYRQQIQQEKEQAELAILDERNRMAREIHDSLAQAFTGISLQLEAASHILSTQPEAAQERLLRAKNLAKEGISEARRSVRALRPEALEFNNLAIALHQLVDKMTSGTGVKTQVIIEGEPQLNPEIEVDLFRIAQEAITNTLRHAQATELTICLISQTDTVDLQIKDNGIGFEPQQLLDKSFGLIGIQERCDRHNGNLTINSSRDQGAEICITIPI